MSRCLKLCGLLFLFCSLLATSTSADRPAVHLEGHDLSQELLPQVLSMVQVLAIAGANRHGMARYVSIAFGRDDYVYSLADQRFIRCIKDHYALTPWRVCGDFAKVRVAVMGESMEPMAPETIWYLAYRDGHWTRLLKDEDGHFTRGNLQPAELPPYAVRCFNLDQKEVLDEGMD
jgi:hypothetical protein